MKFKPNKKYMGIVYNKSTLYVPLPEAIRSGVKEVFTRTGKPFSHCDADKWTELPDNPQDAARMVSQAAQGMKLRQTNRVILCEDPAAALAKGYDLITC